MRDYVTICGILLGYYHVGRPLRLEDIIIPVRSCISKHSVIKTSHGSLGNHNQIVKCEVKSETPNISNKTFSFGRHIPKS